MILIFLSLLFFFRYQPLLVSRWGKKQTHTAEDCVLEKLGETQLYLSPFLLIRAFDWTTAGSYYSTAAQWMGKPVSMVTVKALDVPHPAQSGE